MIKKNYHSINENILLSLYFGYHDSCITFADKTKILLHLEAERVFRKKHLRLTRKQMEHLVNVGLDYLNISINNIEKVYLAQWNNQFEEKFLNLLGRNFKPILTGHHANHIGTGMVAGFEDAVIVCADGGSEDGTTAIYLKKHNKITLLENLNNTILTGKFYGTLTQMIICPSFGRAHDTYPGKTMGLAALGNYRRKYALLLEQYKDVINNLHFNGCEHLLDLFELKPNYDKPWLDNNRCDLAYTAQEYWIKTFLQKIYSLRRYSRNLIFVGGCAYNVVLNTKIVESKLFDNVYITPVSGDCGQSLGALIYHQPTLSCHYPFLGRSFGQISLQTPNLLKKLINDLISKKIIAWYQGESEIGPRALGHRSFLGIPTSKSMRIKLSEKVKKREPYRPVAPIIPIEKFHTYFKGDFYSPYMTFAPKVNDITRKVAPAIVHYNGTSRVQTLDKSTNPFLHTLLLELENVGLPPILMNTSLNIQGEAMVDTPKDALKTFKKSAAEVLYINGKRYE